MRDILFVTSSEAKFKEALQVIPNLKRLEMVLPEIQELDARKIVDNKLATVAQSVREVCLVEDTSLYCEGLSRLPGPLVKWFLKAMGCAGLAKLVLESDSNRAKALCLVGVLLDDSSRVFFEGEINGSIVNPRGGAGFGWDSIFQPDDSDKTFAEMDPEEKKIFSMRTKAFNKVADLLLSC